jgi:hypothetical protein
MASEKSFNIMCSEVLEVLKYCPENDVNKIPNQLINLLNNNKDINHTINIDPNKSIFEQNIIDETIIMIFIIFRNYWATQEEKNEIDKILDENEISFRNFYSYDRIFNQETISKEQPSLPSNDEINQISKQPDNTVISNNTNLIEYDKSILEKIIKKIKNFFNKKIV